MSNRKRTDSFLAVLDFVKRKRKNLESQDKQYISCWQYKYVR